MSNVILADFVKESSTTTGTGTYSLAGAVSGHQGFVAAGCAGAQVPYVVTDGTNYEIGLGTITDAATDTLSRDVVYASSNSGSAVNWSAGTRDVYLADISGKIAQVHTITGNTTLSYVHNLVLCNSASALTVTLPAAASYAGKEFTITNINTGKVTIDGNSTEEIRDPSFGAATTFDLWVQYDSIKIVSDGSAWWVISKNVTAHKALLRRDAAQTGVLTATLTQVNFDAIGYCVGTSYDFAETYELLINRAGKYLITGQLSLGANDGHYINIFVLDSSATEYLFSRDFSSAASGVPYINHAKVTSLAAGVRLGMQMRHTLGSTVSTPTTVVARPELSVTEML